MHLDLRKSFVGILLVAAFLISETEVAALERLDLVVAPGAVTPFTDATGRHVLISGAVSDIDPGVAVVPGSIVATDVQTPDGRNSAFFEGGWLEVRNTSAEFAEDFFFAADQNLTVSFWFRSPGNGPYNPGLPGRGEDRVHALGLGDITNNLDIDLGDADAASANGETALWTYFGGGGSNNVIDSDPAHDRNFYLDDAWHHYSMTREGGSVTVHLDGEILGTTPYSSPLGSISPDARNYIGRASVASEAHTGDERSIYPWFGYIGGFRIFDEAIVPTLCPQSPRSDCSVAAKSILVLKDHAKKSSSDVLVWKWIKGNATADQLADPTDEADYSICFYEGAAPDSTFSQMHISAGAPSWELLGKGNNYKFKGDGESSDGVRLVLLKGSDLPGKAKFIIKGKGTKLPDPPVADLASPLQVQLINQSLDSCFSATYDDPERIKQDTRSLKAKQ